jgi:uncharacterized protein YbbK (DUF523 family)
MREFSKPVVVVSKCITFEHVRWNGQIIASEFVEKLKPYVTFVPVCPEVEIGLGVPRDPVRIVLLNGEKKTPATNNRFRLHRQNDKVLGVFLGFFGCS